MENYDINSAVPNRVAGFVYLIHFDEPFHHARHYIGFAFNVEGRLYHHRKGTGAKLLAALNQAGIGYDVVWVRPGTRLLERQLKNRKKSSQLCPVCRVAHRVLTLERRFDAGMNHKIAA